MRVPSIAARTLSATGLCLSAALGILASGLAAAPRAQRPVKSETPQGATAPGQKPEAAGTRSETTDPVADFLGSMRKAHWGVTEPFGIDRYVATIRITPGTALRREQGTRADTDLAILYLNGQGPARDLMRYRIDFEGNKIQRGVDTDGPWFLDKEGKVRALDEFKEQAEQRRELMRHRRAASMLGKLLDPSAGLDGLTAENPAEKSKFAFGTGGIPAEVLRGHMDRFPLWKAPENSDPELGVDVDLWREEKTGRLFAVEVFPLRKAQKPQGPVPEGSPPLEGKTERIGTSELILLRSYGPKSGLQVPTQIFVFARDPKAPVPLVDQVQLQIRDIDLKPTLTEDRFRRPIG